MLDDDLTAGQRALRDEVRRFAERECPADLRAKVESGGELGKDDYQRWQRILAARGWLTPSWPVEHGGCGWSAVEHYLFEEELAAAGCPPVALTLGVGPKLVGPILCAYGTPRQQARYLPRIRSSLDWWCQGYSEPNAGSDLAALGTRAVRDGDAYVVTGRKVWTSYAHWANLMCCLVRTDPGAKPQAGISFLVVDMTQPGVAVRPIVALNGRHFFNEVILDDVRVPVADRIGPEHGGWGIAKALLEHERLGAARVAETKKRIAAAWRSARARRHGARTLAEHPPVRRRLLQIEIDAQAIERTAMRYVHAARGGRRIGPEIAMLKVRGTELVQRLLDLQCDLSGERALDAADAVAATRLYYRGISVAAGANEIQRDVLARAVLA
jgi:alkylation response protein AidB-like acyl-CoA dehydrogenase